MEEEELAGFEEREVAAEEELAGFEGGWRRRRRNLLSLRRGRW